MRIGLASLESEQRESAFFVSDNNTNDDPEYSKTIFIVDDNRVNLLIAEEILAEHYDIITMTSASAMFELLENCVPNLILLDIMMPGMDGFEALKRLKTNRLYAEIPVIFLTSKNDPDTEALGFEMGATDFISKPFSGPVLLNRIHSHMNIEDIIYNRTKKLLELQNGLVSALASVVESRDNLTGRHIERTAEYIRILLHAMLERGVYADEIREWELDVVVSSGRLHDIGKIAITDLILNKAGKLIESEYELMKTHTTEGEKIIEAIIKESGDSELLLAAKAFAVSHHERWDGTGYPHGLKGTDIPLPGRIMAIADVYDALVSQRSYKEALAHEEAVEIVLKNKGGHFDPHIVDVFREINDLFSKVFVE